MFTRYRIKLSLFLFVLLTGCGGSQEPKQMLGAESFKTYRFDECIAKVEIDKQKTLLHEKYKALSRFIVFEASTKAFKSGSYPLYQIDWTRDGRLRDEYYFFFAALCEDKLKYVDSIVKNYFLAKRKYADVPYEISEITSKELPEGVGGFRGLWTDR